MSESALAHMTVSKGESILVCFFFPNNRQSGSGLPVSVHTRNGCREKKTRKQNFWVSVQVLQNVKSTFTKVSPFHTALGFIEIVKKRRCVTRDVVVLRIKYD